MKGKSKNIFFYKMSLKKGGILGSTVSLIEQMNTWLGFRSLKKTHSTMAAA